MSLLKSSLRLHKVLGYSLGILFFMWFVSGTVMLFCRYPKVTQEHRLAKSLNLTQDVTLPPGPGGESEMSLSIEDYGAGPVARVDGKDILSGGDKADVSGVASLWGTDIVAVDTLHGMDVWLLGRMPAGDMYPIVRYRYESGEELYVSQTTSEPLQFSTRGERLGAWFGAIPHWLYITPLRSLGREPWAWVIIVLSLAGVLMVCLGLVCGIVLAVKSIRHTGRFSPYGRRLQRWHHMAGCIFGIFVLGWIFSGYMSMVRIPGWMVALPESDKIPSFEKVRPGRFELGVGEALTGHDGVKRIEWLDIAGHPVYRLSTSDGGCSLLNAAGPHKGETFVIDRSLCRLLGGEGAEIDLLREYDSGYLSLHGELPLPVWRIKVKDSHGLTIYVNPEDASVRTAGTNSLVRSFLYRGLHCLDFPVMASMSALRRAIMVVFLLWGLFITVTGLAQRWHGEL